jgi:hypothetical protein
MVLAAAERVGTVLALMLGRTGVGFIGLLCTVVRLKFIRAMREMSPALLASMARTSVCLWRRACVAVSVAHGLLGINVGSSVKG